MRNQKIILDYKNGVSNKELCEKYGLHRSTIQRILKNNKIELHKRRSEISCNRNFFKTYNEYSCYWSGFILADGYIRKNRNTLHIKLKSEDRDHLIKFIESIECNDFNLIKDRNKYSTIDISIDEYKNDLLKYYEITPNKTYTAKISGLIPKELLKHFIRGYFDGDGCITKTTVNAINFTGTIYVLDFIRLLFYEELNIRLKSKNTTPPICNQKNNVGQISYSGYNALKILEWMYESSNVFLDRKFIKYTLQKENYE